MGHRNSDGAVMYFAKIPDRFFGTKLGRIDCYIRTKTQSIQCT